ncbi:hypothetical protein AAFC00_004688 [Neodothiora populina]|uniref:Phox-like protein n=1 Tax=Neodothiora populina TaxID=2781224 RepID=A0ABR3P2U3_9PEZI
MPQPLQISVPETSLSSGDKPYTLYHVQLTLPIRIHETSKRYSDFVDLHAALVSQTGLPPPATLPPKTWLRRTVGNPTLTESRRHDLEVYLRAIVDTEDNRWRASSAWRSFLNLPGGGGDLNNNSNGRTKQAMGVPQGMITDPAQWLDVHRDVRTQIHNARGLLKKREGAQTAQEQHAVSAEAKASLVRAAAGIARLEDSLTALSRKKGDDDDDDDDDDGGWGGNAKLGDGEIRRRKDLIGTSKKEIESLESSLKALIVKNAGSMLNGSSGGAAATSADKEALWKGTGAASSSSSSSNGQRPQRSGRVLGGSFKETDRTRELNNTGVLQLQKQVMAEQEQDVLEIGKAVSRMKEMGIMINEELVVQNQMLDLTEQDVDRVGGKIAVAKKKIDKIS